MKLSIRARLLLLCASAAAALCAVSLASWIHLQQALQGLASAHGHVPVVRTAGRIDMLHDTIRSEVLQARLVAAQGDTAALDKARQEAYRAFDAFRDAFEQLSAERLEPTARARLEEARDEAGRYLRHARDLVDVLAPGGASGDAVLRFEASFEKLEGLLEAVTEGVSQDIDRDVVASLALEGHMQRTALGMGLAALAVLVASAVLTYRSIMRPLSALVAATRALNSGQADLSRRLPPAVAELDLLSAEVNRFFDRLAQLVSQVQADSAAIQRESHEIAGGNDDLQRRTETSASHLQETAASVEQINATLQQTAQAAQRAAQLVDTASNAAREGGASMQRLVSTMDDISAASARIVDIVGLIDGIAFQTNILALNASVEAARAGEQGRGFAVVANEVRALAQKTATAAREIGVVIRDAASKVEARAVQVRDAGASMTHIVHSVQHVAGTMGEISVAAGEQSVGMRQVNTAVAALDRMLQQNSSLVEQSAAAAQVLSERATHLADAVAGYGVAAAA